MGQLQSTATSAKKDVIAHQPNSPLSTPIEYSLAQALAIRSLFLSGFNNNIPFVPNEIIDLIFDYAEIYYCIKSEGFAGLSNCSNANIILLSLEIPILQQNWSIVGLEFSVDSHDQGWSSYQSDHGTTNNSWTWGEFSISPFFDFVNSSEADIQTTIVNQKVKLQTDTFFLKNDDMEICEKEAFFEKELTKGVFRHRMFTNIHAEKNWKTHTAKFMVVSDSEKKIKLNSLLSTGDKVHLIIRSAYPGWNVYARNGSITLKVRV